MATTPAAASVPLDLFYSYSHRDEDLRDELAKHLALLERRKIIRSWHDRKITAGAEWAGKIDKNIEAADIVLLLVSADFIASDYCYEKEMKRALERHAQGAARTVPVIVRPCDWHDSEFGRLQVLPKDGKAVASWPIRDEAWTDVAKGIRKLAVELGARAPAAPPPAAPSPGATRGGRRRSAVRPAAPDESGSASHYKRALEEFEERITGAILERTSTPGEADPAYAERMKLVDRRELTGIASRLASIPGAKRLLWVDDQPALSRREREALLGMQVEIVTALSTEEGLELVRTDREGLDLIVSDWERDPRKDPSLPEGLRLAFALQELRKTLPQAPPLVFYHGIVAQAEADERRALAKQAGALATTAHPGELLRLIVTAIT